MNHMPTLIDIIQVNRVSMTAERVGSIGIDLTADQQAKVDQIKALLIEIGDPTVDEELDATIDALVEIRDRL
jgi:hypothetical protein